MRKYRANAASEARISYGIELCAGLRFFSETATLTPAFETLNNELDTAHTCYAFGTTRRLKPQD